jgi:hypothetical protein
VNVPVGGKFLLSTNGHVNFTADSSLTVGGQLEVQAGARLRLDGSSPARDLTLLAGSVLSGLGTIQLDGSCRLVVPGDLDTTVGINLSSASAQLVVPGTYTVRSSRSMSGTINSVAVIIASNATLSVSSANFTGQVRVESGGTLQTSGGTVSFQTNVTVASGAEWDVPLSTALVLNGALTNAGTLRWVSDNNAFDLGGSGRVENAGLWEVFTDPGCPTCASEAVVRVPVNVPVGGKFLLSTNAHVNFTAGSSLTVGGQLEVQSGARLRLDSSNPARDLALAAGSSLLGAGTITLEGDNRVVLLGNVSVATALLDFTGASTIAGTNLLTIAPGSTVRFDHTATIPGSVTVNGTLTLTGSPRTLTMSGTLTLELTGVLNNSDTIRVGVLVNNGGQINGNAPVVVGPAVQPLRIDHIQFSPPTWSGKTPVPAISSPGTVILTWRARPGARFFIEASVGFRSWAELPATVLETSPGAFRATLVLTGSAARFYRLRVVPMEPSIPPAPN